MNNIAIADYQDYLVVAKKKVCFSCKEEYPEDTQFYTPFTFGEKMCEECVTDFYQGTGEL